MKKQILLAGTVLATLALAACGGNNDEGGNGGKPKFPGANFLPERNITLTVAESNEGMPAEVSGLYVKDFEEKFKDYGIKVNVIAFDGNSWKLDAPAGKGADIIIASNDSHYLYNEKLVMPVDPATMAMEDNSDVPEWAWDAFSRGGQNYAYPLTLQTSALFYRKDIVPAEWKDENGDIKIKTWNDVYKLNKEIIDGKHPGLEGGFMAGMDNFYKNWGMLQPYGAVLFENENPLGTNLNKGNAYLGGRVIRDLSSTMYDKVVNWEVYNQIGNNIAKGKFIGIYETPNKVAELKQSLVTEKVAANLDEAEKLIGSMPLPLLPKDGDVTKDIQWSEENADQWMKTPSMGGLTGAWVSSYTQYPNAARLLATFITKEKYQMARALKSTLVPCREKAINEPTLPKYLQDVHTQAMENGFLCMSTMSELGQVWGPAGTALQKFTFNHVAKSDFTDTVSTDEKIKAVLEKATKDINSAIEVLA